MDRLFLALGSVSGFLAVALGAFGAHLLRDRIAPELVHTFETAQRQHVLHVVALLAVAWASTRWPGPATTAAGWLFVAGTLLFSGSLYLLAITGQRWLGAITPFGGLALLLGWLVLAWRAWTSV
ncbi:MAG: DUF423 domain-containing protein [Candidatus Rokubacteria bacterium]|nr:DUF423 domain-containing protein [Candidatus Rokubacteria bacterium]